jgi:cobalt-zinc-cadmium efflux system protein
VAADLIVSLAIGALILVSSWRLVREAVHILMEGAPRDLDVDDLLRQLGSVEGVEGVHDLHVWTITSGYTALSMHAICADGQSREMLLARMNRLLRERFGIEHTTIQMESRIPPERDVPMSRPVQRIE